jgi:hypothetical protein
VQKQRIVENLPNLGRQSGDHLWRGVLEIECDPDRAD